MGGAIAARVEYSTLTVLYVNGIICVPYNLAVTNSFTDRST
ncbi:hypothetical protein BUC_6363 [Burkholderia pseudomallei 576]|nr:hypothetical protein BUC_6363 [Burkholderia pseudomallei 576]